jgi:hypothetical protein
VPDVLPPSGETRCPFRRTGAQGGGGRTGGQGGGGRFLCDCFAPMLVIDSEGADPALPVLVFVVVSALLTFQRSRCTCRPSYASFSVTSSLLPALKALVTFLSCNSRLQCRPPILYGHRRWLSSLH